MLTNKYLSKVTWREEGVAVRLGVATIRICAFLTNTLKSGEVE